MNHGWHRSKTIIISINNFSIWVCRIPNIFPIFISNTFLASRNSQFFCMADHYVPGYKSEFVPQVPNQVGSHRCNLNIISKCLFMILITLFLSENTAFLEFENFLKLKRNRKLSVPAASTVKYCFIARTQKEWKIASKYKINLRNLRTTYYVRKIFTLSIKKIVEKIEI